MQGKPDPSGYVPPDDLTPRDPVDIVVDGGTNKPELDNSDSYKATVKTLFKGNMGYYVPPSMIVDSSYIVLLKISKNISQKNLGKDLKIFIANESNADTQRIVLGRVDMTETMRARLYAKDRTAFDISPMSSFEQAVLLSDMDTTMTTWKWSVKPLKAGKHMLNIVVIAIIRDKNNRQRLQDLEVYQGLVPVKAVPKSPKPIHNNIIDNWRENWTWIIPTLSAIGGLITWLLNMFSRKKQELNDDKEQKHVAN